MGGTANAPIHLSDVFSAIDGVHDQIYGQNRGFAFLDHVHIKGQHSAVRVHFLIGRELGSPFIELWNDTLFSRKLCSRYDHHEHLKGAVPRFWRCGQHLCHDEVFDSQPAWVVFVQGLVWQLPAVQAAFVQEKHFPLWGVVAAVARVERGNYLIRNPDALQFLVIDAWLYPNGSCLRFCSVLLSLVEHFFPFMHFPLLPFRTIYLPLFVIREVGLSDFDFLDKEFSAGDHVVVFASAIGAAHMPVAAHGKLEG